MKIIIAILLVVGTLVLREYLSGVMIRNKAKDYLSKKHPMALSLESKIQREHPEFTRSQQLYYIGSMLKKLSQ